MNTYMSAVDSIDDAIANFASKNITYFACSEDTCNESLFDETDGCWKDCDSRSV